MDGDGWRWMARLQLDIKGWHDGESTAMGDKEQCKQAVGVTNASAASKHKM